MIPHALSGLSFVERFYPFPTVDSTNEFARNLDKCPSNGLYVIQADKQTAGRGRRGTPYFSENGGLWVSIMIPVKDISTHFNYNRSILLAILDTIKERFNSAQLAVKWPNDLYWADKKICGILLENHNRFKNILVVGFGLNVNFHTRHFPSQLHPIATSILIETGRTWPPGKLLHRIMEFFYNYIHQNPQSVHNKYLKYLYKTGAVVEINQQVGILESVDIDGQLRIVQNGKTVLVNNGKLRYLE
jgi:BirA family biotin operon repressor/biotin-[acetyl-CoA-carboxylase] ligase